MFHGLSENKSAYSAGLFILFGLEWFYSSCHQWPCAQAAHSAGRDGSWYMLPRKQCHGRPIFRTWSLDQQGYLTTVLLLARGSHCLNQALHSSLLCVFFRAYVAHTRLTTADVTDVIKYTCPLFVAWGTGEQSYVTRKLCCYLHALLQLMVHTAVAELPPPASCDKDHLPESREEH